MSDKRSADPAHSITVKFFVKIFTGEGAAVSAEEAMSFGAAVELSAAMPLSWLPLISDYTSKAEKPVMASAVSAVIYGLGERAEAG